MKAVGLGSNHSESSGNRTSASQHDRVKELWHLLVQEARAVSLWSLLAVSMRILVVFLAIAHSSLQDSSKDEGELMERIESSGIWKEGAVILCVLCGWILALTPSKVPLLQAPGFIFANPWLLLWVRDKTGVLPSVPIRSCEYIMGRISLLELVAVLPIHIVTVVSTSVFLRSILPTSIVLMAVDPIEYSDGRNPWLVDFSREVIASAAFSVALLVLPVLFQLNHLPRWLVAFVLYPLLNFSVDGSGMASVFSPNVLIALNVLSHRPLPSLWRLLASLLGGLVAGRVMKLYFPDQH